MVSSTLGSPTMTGWKRRSRAASRSICLRYSSRVVAPMHCNSPRAKAGLRIFAASIAPSAAPAPIKVWTSSITKITLPAVRISSMIFLRRSSNSPRYFVPATSKPISKVTTRFSWRISGISLLIMRCAKPSAIAVLPTPGSPIKTGLFLVRRPRIWITRSISFSRPTTGSSLPSWASCVKLEPNSSRVGVLVRPPPPPAVTSAVSPNMRITWVRTLDKSTPRFSKTLAATPSPSRISPSNRCSVPI